MEKVIAGAVVPASGCTSVNNALGSSGSIGFVWSAVTNVPIALLRLAEAKLLMIISDPERSRVFRVDEKHIEWLRGCKKDARVAIPEHVAGSVYTAQQLLLAGTHLAQTPIVPFVHSLVPFILLCLTNLKDEAAIKDAVEGLPTVMCLQYSL